MQTLPREQWEVLLVDNASKEPLADRCDLSWHPAGRHVREEALGLTPARLRGIREAMGGLIVFVDDDNVLAPDYLQEAVAIGSEYALLGAWGGRIQLQFETRPPEWTKPYWKLLAVREFEAEVVELQLWGGYTAVRRRDGCPPDGCVSLCRGMLVRRPQNESWQKREFPDVVRRHRSWFHCL